MVSKDGSNGLPNIKFQYSDKCMSCAVYLQHLGESKKSKSVVEEVVNYLSYVGPFAKLSKNTVPSLLLAKLLFLLVSSTMAWSILIDGGGQIFHTFFSGLPE